MAVTFKFSEVAIGGSGVNNPPNYSWTDFSNYPDLPSGKSFRRINVIHFNTDLQVNLEVTALAEVQAGVPLIGENDLAYMPCPPYCPR